MTPEASAPETAVQKAPASAPHPLDALFHPRTVAVVGASTDPRRQGGTFLGALKEFPFRGKLFAVNPKASEILGVPCYPRLTEVPEPVDYVISNIPAEGTVQLMEDCLAKGVMAVHFFTAGYSETGEPDRIELERRILELAKRGGIRVIGPNCMGIYCPESGLTFSAGFPQEPGPVAMISQSGTNASEFVREGTRRGLRFSKVVSFGNAGDVNAAELLDYLGWDRQTEVIACYLEGVRDGRRLFQALREVAARKPVFILKGGRTAGGARAVASHTSSLAGEDVLWDALCRQTGAIRVFSVEELVDLAVTFRFLPRPAGPRIAIIGGGGGLSVLATDDCESAGLEVPPLPAAVKVALRPMVPYAGHSINNPLDASPLLDARNFARGYEVLATSPALDLLLIHFGMGWDRYSGDQAGQERFRTILETVRERPLKPCAFVLRPATTANEGRNVENLSRLLQEAGLPFYNSMAGAAKAVRRYLDYHARRNADVPAAR